MRDFCSRHITTSFDPSGYHWDNRIQPIEEPAGGFVDTRKALAIWADDDRTLCLDCRNAILSGRRDEYVFALSLPEIPSGTPVQQLLALVSRSELQGCDKLVVAECQAAGFSIDARQLSDLSIARSRAFGAMLPELYEPLLKYGPAQFAKEWIPHRDIHRGTYAPVGRMGRKESAWPVAAGFYLTANCDWLVPAKSSSWSASHQGVQDSGTGVARWRSVEVSPSDWTRIVSGLTRRTM